MSTSATTPHRTNMPACNTPSKSPSRRVLGDLTPKAINTPTKQAYSRDLSRPQSPLKQVQTLSSQLFKGAENMPPVGAFQAGRKRSIYEVDDVENAGRMYGRGGEGPMRKAAPVSVAALNEHTVSVDDATPGSPTEVNTPSVHEEHDEHLDLPDNSQDTQASKTSFSEYFDYTSEIVQQPIFETRKEPIVDPAQKKSKIELLRLGLGIGMYKIKTNQLSTRGKDIISNWEITSSSARSLNTSSSTAVTTSVDSSLSQAIASAKMSEPKSIYANLDPGRPIGKLTAGPILLPTVPTSRMIYDHPLPSSPPPTSIAPEQLMSPERALSNFGISVPHKMRTVDEDYEDEEEEEEMETNEAVDEHLHRIQEQQLDEGDLMSPAGKGHAAKGLLELMTSRR